MKLKELSEQLVDLVQRVVPCTAAIADVVGARISSGSGLLIDDDGHIVTNHHVIEGMDPPVDVAIGGSALQEADVVGSDLHTDLALVKLRGPVKGHLSFRDEPPRLGEICIAIGSPLGIYTESVALGMVSGLARTIPRESGRPLENAIQTDAAINPGNSGGPLVDANGDVIGISVAGDIRANGIGFAIPADTARWVVSELIEHGAVERASLGVAVAERDLVIERKARARLVITRVSKSTRARGPAHGGPLVAVRSRYRLEVGVLEL